MAMQLVTAEQTVLAVPPAEFPPLPLIQLGSVLDPGSVIHCFNLWSSQFQLPSPRIYVRSTQTSKVCLGYVFLLLLCKGSLVITLILNAFGSGLHEIE